MTYLTTNMKSMCMKICNVWKPKRIHSSLRFTTHFKVIDLEFKKDVHRWRKIKGIKTVWGQPKISPNIFPLAQIWRTFLQKFGGHIVPKFGEIQGFSNRKKRVSNKVIHWYFRTKLWKWVLMTLKLLLLENDCRNNFQICANSLKLWGRRIQLLCLKAS